MISVEQRFQVLAALGQNIDWDSLSTEQVQVGVREAKRAGGEATAFIQNGFRMQTGDEFRAMEALGIEIPALARPTLAELQAEYPYIKLIKWDSSPTEAVKLDLGTVLRPDEAEGIHGQEYERRLAPKLNLILGYQQAKWLVEHQDEFLGLSSLSRNVRIDFFGLGVVNADGSRNIPCFRQFQKRWYIDWRWFEHGFTPQGRIAMSGASR